MKATHISKGKKIAKVKVEFWISQTDIMIAIDNLIDFGYKITKKNVEEQIQNNLRALGEYSIEDRYMSNDYAMIEELASKLYPDFF